MTAASLAARRRAGLGAGLTVLAMFCFASMDAVSKALVVAYPVAQMLWVRYAFFALFAVLIAGRAGTRRALRPARPVLQFLLAMVSLLEGAVFVLAFAYLPLADTHALAATSPLMVVALSYLILGERADLARWCAVAAGFLGVLLIVRPGFVAISWTILLPLLAAFLWGLYQVLARLAAATDPVETTLVWVAWGGLAVAAALGSGQWVAPDAWGWTCLVLIALLGTAGHYALLQALNHADASAIQPFGYFLLVWATVLGSLFFGQFPDGWTLLGAGIIIASGMYSWLQEQRRAVGTR